VSPFEFKAEEKLEEEYTTEIVQVNTISNGQIFVSFSVIKNQQMLFIVLIRSRLCSQ